MRTPSTRTLAALGYGRGEEFDPALASRPALVEQLTLGQRAARPLEAVSPYERRRRRERERRRRLARVRGWFSPGDLVERPVGVHGEPV
jgi:hypothetical protein